MNDRTARIVINLSIVAALALAAVVLFWADRSTSLVDIARDIVVDVGRDIEGESGIDLVDRDDIPGTRDQIGHAAFWALVTLVLGWMGRRRVPLVFTGLVIGGISVAVELGQPRFSNRSFSIGDMTANLAGVGLALVALVALGGFERLIWGENRQFVLDRYPKPEPELQSSIW